MGGCFSTGAPIADFTGLGLGARHLTKEQARMVDVYLPDFRIHEQSTERHRQIAANHWNSVFRETRNSLVRISVTESAYAPSSSRSPATPTPSVAPTMETERDSVARSTAFTQSGSKIGSLFDAFYGYLDDHSPELKPLFRSSLRVKGKILVHISAGMRSILASEHVVDKMAALTKTHLRFGVQLQHFNPLGRALLHAMEVVSEDVWTSEVADAWRRLFAHCSAILMVLQQKAIDRKEYGAPVVEKILVAPQTQK